VAHVRVVVVAPRNLVNRKVEHVDLGQHRCPKQRFRDPFASRAGRFSGITESLRRPPCSLERPFSYRSHILQLLAIVVGRGRPPPRARKRENLKVQPLFPKQPSI
jgi:hypothetical protein